MQTDLMGGYINILFDNLPAALPQIRGGKFLPLAVTSLKRQPDLPDVPTMDELGFSKFETGAWYGLFLPAKTPGHIVEQLNSVVNKLLNEPTLQTRFPSPKNQPVAMSFLFRKLATELSMLLIQRAQNSNTHSRSKLDGLFKKLPITQIRSWDRREQWTFSKSLKAKSD
jgi:hypothetical protein